MKVCKKCKKNIPNNLKICRYCGADVSKIKPNNSAKKNSDTKIKKEKLEKKVVQNKKIKNTERLETNAINIDKTEILETIIVDTLKKETKRQEEKADVTSNLVEEKDILSDFNVFNEKKSKKNKLKDLTKAQQIYFIKKKLKRRKIMRVFLTIILFLLLVYIFYSFINNIDDFGYVVKGDESIEEVSFNMGDMISYNDIEYVISTVETSTGTAYKKPKKDNIYLIIGLSLENKSDDKHHYSGTYFTILNSALEESNRIISPVNAGEDLYSGSLVVGGKKEGSLVFEVPKDDKELFLQYYNPIELEEYEMKLEEQEKKENDEEREEIKKPSPKFRVKIRVD